MQGYSNISGEKLQFFFTKPPVTMVIEDSNGNKIQSRSSTPSYNYEHTTEMEFQDEYFHQTEATFTEKSNAYNFYDTVSYNDQKNYPKATTKESPVKMYESIKHLSLKPVSLPEVDNFNEIRSDGQYFNVLEEMLAPKEVLFKERSNKTKFHPLKIRDSPNAIPFVAQKSTPTPRPRLPDNTRSPSNNATPATPEILVEGATSKPAAANASSLNEKLVFEGLQNVRTASDKLTDEITTMLVNLGILRMPNETSTPENGYPTGKNDSIYETDPKSYLQFKKIPTYFDGEPARDDMQKLLDSFGLLPKKDVDNSLTRIVRQTQLQVSSTVTRNTRPQRILLDIIVNPRARNMQNFFHLMNPNNYYKNNEKVDSNATDSKDDNDIRAESSTKVSLRENFSKPMTKPLARVSEMAKGAVNRRQGRQNPFLDRRRQLELLNRNGIRRRQMAAETKNTTTASKSTSNNETVSPRIGNSASETALMESFGGNMTEDVSTPRPNGLYFFVDWNTFMNVGMPDDSNMVHVKFSPRVGNPRNFVPITLP